MSNLKQSAKKARPRRLVPEHLRRHMPEIEQFEQLLTVLLATAKEKNLPIGGAAMPKPLRDLLPDCHELDELRQALVLLRSIKSPVTPDAMFRAFASLRALSDPEQLTDLMDYLVGAGVEHAKSVDPMEVDAARCFAALAGQAWQCGSLFPSHAEDYAAWVRMWLESRTPRKGKSETKSQPMPAGVRADYRPPVAPPRDDDIRLLKTLLLSGGVEEHADAATRCGFAAWRAENAAAVTESEYALRYGLPSRMLTRAGWGKHDEFASNLERSAFPGEWAVLKRRFPEQTADSARRIFHRTLIRERKWQRDDIARFDTEEQKFRAFFDLLCWKYCLWGVENDRPLLMRPSVNLTPYGTQIFIPAYLSVDFKRDLDLKYLSDLHKARGVPKQGAELARIREESRRRAVEVAEGDQDARENGIRGEERHEHVSRYLRRKGGPIMDGAQISREAKRGRKIQNAEERRAGAKPGAYSA